MLDTETTTGSMPSTEGRGEPLFEINTSRNFIEWLAATGSSLAFSTYQVGKLFFLGVKPDGKLWVFNRNIGRCLGLAADGRDLWATADSQIVKFVNVIEPGQLSAEGHDALFVPQVGYFTGDLDAHDIGLGTNGAMVFVNTLFNCLANVSDSHSFAPWWKPAFISRLAAEDRCHLNGVAMRDGTVSHVTAVSTSDTFDGWRSHRTGGGVVIDVANGEIVCEGLSMPHSPRWNQGRLWLHNSGTGEFGWVDFEARRFVPLTFCPGYLRGLAFIGNMAVVGMSKPRDNKTFTGLPLDAALAERRIEARCGLYVIDLATGDIAHSATIEGIVTELYDVVALPGCRQPAAIGPGTPDLKRIISIKDTD